MDLQTFIEQVGEALSELPEGHLTADTDFKSLAAWDSLAVLTVTDTIECEYGVLLKKQDYHACRTLEELFQLVQSRQ